MQLPPYASDIIDSIRKIYSCEIHKKFTHQEVFGISLTAGYALKNERLLNQIRSDAIIVFYACCISTGMKWENAMAKNNDILNLYC